MWSQAREKGLPVSDSLWAISHSWWVLHHLAGAAPQRVLRVAGELAVLGERGDGEVHAGRRLVSVALADQVLRRADLLAHVLGRFRADIGRREVQPRPVLLVSAGVKLGELPNVVERLALLALQGALHLVLAPGVGDVVLGQVPNVGDVRDPRHPEPERGGGADDEVGGEKAPEVADVRVAVHRRAAGVKPQVPGLAGLHRAHLAREGVVQPEGRKAHAGLFRVYRGGVRRRDGRPRAPPARHRLRAPRSWRREASRR